MALKYKEDDAERTLISDIDIDDVGSGAGKKIPTNSAVDFKISTHNKSDRHRKITVSENVPSDGDGDDGDVWIVI